jgi:hypothetical protein
MESGSAEMITSRPTASSNSEVTGGLAEAGQSYSQGLGGGFKPVLEAEEAPTGGGGNTGGAPADHPVKAPSRAPTVGSGVPDRTKNLGKLRATGRK